MVRVLADNIHHVIDGNPAQQPPLVVHHRRRNQIIALKQVGYFGVGEGDGYRLDIGIHDFPHGCGLAGYQHCSNGQHADKFVAPVYNNQAVGHRRQSPVPAQVSQYHINAEVRAHSDGVRVHQAASGVFRVGKHRFDPLPVLLVHGVQNFLDHRIRQLLQKVGEIVGLEVLYDIGQFLSVQSAQVFGTNVLIEVLENIAFQLFVDQVPEQGTLARWRGFEQVSNITGAQAAIENACDLFQGTTVQSFTQ